ncbi:MAG: hypothetical protein KY454_01215 [Actinobacteria bacterium]|nr:hypothetical protein [Actinomycetota bacterium]MBW3649924.1 hypothetical protein [Actinomycetota bacterium]
MISGWLVKVVLGIALLGLAALELGSPLIVRAQADDAAHEVANEASFRLRDSYTQQTLDAACSQEAAEQEVQIKVCTVNEKRDVVVTVTKEAKSYLLHKIPAFKSWYEVQASATASAK